MENIQQMIATFFNGSCYGYCLTHLFKPNFSTLEMSIALLNAWNYGYLEDDGHVSFPIRYIKYVLGIPNVADVTKVSIKSLDELPKGEWIVEYKSTDNKTYFVVATKNKVVFNPSGEDVDMGNPVSYREFIYSSIFN